MCFAPRRRHATHRTATIAFKQGQLLGARELVSFAPHVERHRRPGSHHRDHAGLASDAPGSPSANGLTKAVNLSNTGSDGLAISRALTTRCTVERAHRLKNVIETQAHHHGHAGQAKLF